MAKRKLYSQTDEDRINRIGERIRTIRKLKGLTVENLSEKLGCTKQFISVLETSNRLSVGTLIALCRVLETTPNILLGYDTKLENVLDEIEKLKCCFFKKTEDDNEQK